MGGSSNPGVGCGNAELAACGALTVIDANALANDSVVKTLPPGVEGGERPERRGGRAKTRLEREGCLHEREWISRRAEEVRISAARETWRSTTKGERRWRWEHQVHVRHLETQLDSRRGSCCLIVGED